MKVFRSNQQFIGDMRDRGNTYQSDSEYGNCIGKNHPISTNKERRKEKKGQQKEQKLFQVKIYESCLDPSLNKPTTEDNKTTKPQL